MITTMPRRDQHQTPQRLLGMPTQVRLSAGQRDGLELVAASRGVALGAVIRDAIDAYLAGFVGTTGPHAGRSLLEVAEDGELGDFVAPDLGDADQT